MKPLKHDVIGRMRKHVEIQQDNGTTADAFNQGVENWQTVFYAWAAIEPLDGNELLNAAQMQSAITGKMTLRYRGDFRLTSDMRAVLGTRVFQFAGPARNIDELNGFWEVPFVETVLNPK